MVTQWLGGSPMIFQKPPMVSLELGNPHETHMGQDPEQFEVAARNFVSEAPRA